MITRRATCQLLASTAVLAASGALRPAFADQEIKVGIDLSLTGADSESAQRILYGAQLAFNDANARHAIPGHTIKAVVYDDGTATAGQYDPAQAATNARRMVSEGMVAAVGPMMSGAGKAMAPILSQGDLATITPSSTNPDITDPKFGAEYDPSGKAIYFRTVTTDAYQGPELANFFAQKLALKTVYVLDDSGDYGVGLADAFQKRAPEVGMKVLGRDRLDPKAADYTPVLTKMKAIAPEALYYGGVGQAGSSSPSSRTTSCPKS
jgi:branched-chain amino acid transport system substrate-binding protein